MSRLRSVRVRWLSPRSLVLHLALVVWVVGCVVAAWWQVGRAIQGNQYSYLYAVEWPVFAVAGIFGWWALLHTEPVSRRGAGGAPRPRAATPRGGARQPSATGGRGRRASRRTTTTSAAGSPRARPSRKSLATLMQGALLRYRVMSFVTGTALILLVFVAIPLSEALPPQDLRQGPRRRPRGGPLPAVPAHRDRAGLAFLTRLRWWWWRPHGALAGFVPFLAFVMEHYVTKAIRAGARHRLGHRRSPGPRT